MTIGRRTFLRHSALIGALSALASFLSLSSIVSHAELLPASSSPQPDEVGTDSNSVEFKIDGWNCADGARPRLRQILRPVSYQKTTSGSVSISHGAALGDELIAIGGI
jgi:hypothetical protein